MRLESHRSTHPLQQRLTIPEFRVTPSFILRERICSLSIDVVGFHAVLTMKVFGVLFRLMRRQSLPERSEGHDGETEGAWLPFYRENLVQRQALHR